jgi:TIGR03009 family protein
VLNPKDPLDAILMNYEFNLKQIDTLSVECVRSKLDKVYQNTEVFEGKLLFMKPNRASLTLTKKGNPGVYEKYICTGNFLYEFVPGEKKLRVYSVPEPKPGQTDNVVLKGIGLPTRALEAKTRFQLSLVPAPPEQAKWYYFIKIIPLLKEDKANFTEARLVLTKSTFLPRQIWFKEVSQNEITFDFPKMINPDPNVKATDFAPPALPKDWKQEKGSAQPQPSVFRLQSK